MDSRQQRIARNEATFRLVNERIEEVNRSLANGFGSEADFLCECGSEECVKPISLTLREYEQVRSDPAHFAIVPGHEVLDVERVVARTERFAVVEKKTPAAARIARETDPRS